MKVFQYYSSAEDNLCGFQAIDDYIFFTVKKNFIAACYGEVWTDEDTNIIRISEHLELPDKSRASRGWDTFRIVLTYGWVKRLNEGPWLVPLTTFTEAREKKHIYWCRGNFTDYRVFTVQSRVIRK